MARVNILIEVQDEPSVAVPLAQGIVDWLKAHLEAEGHTLDKNQIKFLCDRCGQMMRLHNRTLVCEACLRDEAEDAQLDRLHMAPAPVVLQPLEATF